MRFCPRSAGGEDWRQKLDVQPGAVLANELKHNACKLAKWTSLILIVTVVFIEICFYMLSTFFHLKRFKSKKIVSITSNCHLSDCYLILFCETNLFSSYVNVNYVLDYAYVKNEF